MNYSIKKDAKPNETIQKIKSILNKYKIDIKVRFSAKGNFFCSTRHTISHSDIGTNGKGTSEINALASGYAELMERLQTQWLFEYRNENFIFHADEKLVPLCNYTDAIIQNDFKNSNFNQKNIEKLISLFFFFSEDRKKRLGDNVSTIPFVSYKTKKIEYLSTFLIELINGTNGLSSGNTYEEACVQGLSEIIERYCTREIFSKKIKLPLIPKDCYEKYEKIKNLIKEIENIGYKITIKDASLGKNFPTFCCIFEDIKKNKNTIIVKFGSHPYLPIALERTLTEFLQGYNDYIKNPLYPKLSVIPNSIKVRNIIWSSFVGKSCLKKTNRHLKNLLSDEADYKFNKKAWEYDENLTNKELFNKLCKLILKHADNIYIKNHSFLGFPTVRIYIPKFSSPYILDSYYFKNWLRAEQWVDCVKNRNLTNNMDVNDLMETCKFFNDTYSEIIEKNFQIGRIHIKYLGLYCAIFVRNKRQTKYYLRKVINFQSIENGTNKENLFLKTCQAYNKYYKLKWKNLSDEKIKEIIVKKYGTKLYNEIIHTIANINYDFFKKILQEKIVEDPIKEFNLKHEELLGELFWQNIPDQNEIVKIID